MNNLHRALAGIALAGLGALATSASAQEYQIKLGLIAPQGHPVTEASKRFAEEVEQSTQGKVSVQIYPGGQLGGEIELQDQVALGTIQAANIGTPVMSGKLKKLDILNMYYLWESRDHMNRVLTGPIGEDLWAQYEQRTGARVIAANWQQGTRHALTMKPATTPEEMAGIKIRVTAGVPLYNDLWTAMGANPVPLGFPEAYPAMKQGVIDAVELPLNWMIKGGFVELGNYVDLTAHYFYTNVMIMNARFLESLPEELREKVVDVAVRAGEYNTQLVLADESALREQIKSEGIEFVEADQEAFRASVQKVYQQKMDVWGEELFERVEAAALD